MRAATPAPADKLEKNGKEVEEEKEEGESPAEKEKEKEKDVGKEAENNRTGDPEEVGDGYQIRNYNQLKHLFPVILLTPKCY